MEKTKGIIEPAVALDILQQPENKALQEKLFSYIYSQYKDSFLNWILTIFAHNPWKDRLREDAKDAFQNGLTVFYLKAQKKDFKIGGSLKTAVYSFGLYQLLAFFKKDKFVYGTGDYIKWFETFTEDTEIEKERQILLDEKERSLIEALATLPKKRQAILVMKFFHHLKSKEIAEMLNVTPGNVDNESCKAYKKLRTILGVELQT